MFPDIQHDEAAQRFQTSVDGAICVLDYIVLGGLMTITHTNVPSRVGGRGIAAALVQTALDQARGRGWKVRPACSYAAVWMQRHPEYLELQARDSRYDPAIAGSVVGAATEMDMVEHKAGLAGNGKKHRWRPMRSVKARPRMVISLLIFIVVGTALIALKLRPATAILLAFDLAAVVLLGSLARMFNRASQAHMRMQAKAQDSGRWGVLWSGIVLATVVLVALGSELHASKGGGLLALGVGALSVVLSWLFLNIMFAMHYAHGFYGDFGEKHSGLEFPDTPEPDYWDFVYFAIVIGMTFQVSDVQITSRYLRRVALLQSVIAFFFNVFIIAITVNIVAGQGG